MKSAIQSDTLTVVTRTAAETQAFGRKLAVQLHPGDVVALTGDLGAGKTCLAQGVAAGLGIVEPITSPTFTLIAEHFPPPRGKHKLPFYHVDLYRLDSPAQAVAQAIAIGIEEYLDGDGVTFIEWAEKIKRLWPPQTIRVRIQVLSHDKRQIQCSPWPSKPPVP